jgi:hypothetical protein
MSIYGSEYGNEIISGELGSNAITAAADNSGNTKSLGNSAGGDGAFLGEGVRSGIDSWDKAYTDAGGKLPSRFGLSDLKQFATDNKSWLAGAGALASVYGGGSGADKKTGYQGVIPTLSASRSMVTAPPTRAQGYRPGAGGIDYGGDVSYTLAPGQDPWASLSGRSGSSAGANLTNDVNTSNAASQAAAAAAAKAAADLAAAQKAGNAAAIAAAQKAADAAAAAAKAAADKAAANKLAADKAAADKLAADKLAADKLAANKTIADAAAKAAADLAAAKKAGDAAAIAAAQKALDAANKAAADKAAADKAATGKTTNVGSVGYQAAIKSGLTPEQYYGNINQWLIDNPRASKTEIDDAMKTFGVSKEDLQTALGTSKFSDYTKYGLTQGQGLQELNFKISDWVAKNPFATAQEIKDAMKAAGVNQEDIGRGINALSASAGKEAALVGGMGLDQLYKNILDYQSKSRTPEEIAAALAATGLEQRDLDAAQKYAKEKGYVGNPNSEAATFDYLGKTATTATNNAAASNSNTAVIESPIIKESVVSPVVPTAPVTPVKPTDTEIFKFLTDNPTLSDEVIAAIMNDTGLKPEDIARATGAKLTDVQSRYDAVTPAAVETDYFDQQFAPDVSTPVYTPPAVETPAVSEAVAAPTGIETLIAPAVTPSVIEQAAEQPAQQIAEQAVEQPAKQDDIYQYFSDPSTQAMLASGDVQSIAETMQALGWSPAEVAAATGANPDEVQAAYDAALGVGLPDTSYMRAATGGYLGYADGGEIAMAKGRYLQGGTDGMADELPARIGRDQPAALSHGEFVIPADVVSHMGNGNSDAGAKKLYQMMDKIRMARTGNKKQGKKINPDKFMPGGLAAAYAAGGAVKRFEEGGLTTANKNSNLGISGVESNLSNWAGPYVTNMLGQGQALSNMPYQAYMGQLTAGESPLQTQGFGAAAGMTVPTSLTTAAQTAGDVASTAKKLPAYSSGTFSNQFTAPDAYSPNTATNQFSTPTPYSTTNFANQYTAPTDIPEATKFTNQYTNTGAYTPTTSKFDQAQLQSYMNPYLELSLKPQLEEARRQSQLTQQQNASRMSQAGAYGGSRQAILDAENQRNLGTNLANITGQGYNTAYGNATNQFNADQNRKMQEAQFGAQQGMTAAQLQAQYGLSAQQANEMARQFESQQKMNAAQQFAQFGQTANQATEASKQFGAQMGMTAAQQAAQYGQSAQQQNELAKQFAAQQGMTSAQQKAQYGLAGQQAAEQSKQFGANYGLQGLQTGLQAAQTQGSLGTQINQAGLGNLNAMLTAGAQQRGIESEGIAADKAQFEEARANPYKMIQYQQSLLQGLPLAAQSYQGIAPSDLTKAAQGATTVNQLLKNLGLA